MNKKIKILSRDYNKYNYSSVCINERNIPYAERYKEAYAEICNDAGNVEWLTQESDSPSDEFNQEIIRAFKANGLKPGSIIDVAYGIRDDGLTEFYTLTVN